MIINLTGRRAVVTGSTAGIGLATNAPDIFWLTHEELLANLAKVAAERDICLRIPMQSATHSNGEAGHWFRFEAAHRSDLMSST